MRERTPVLLTALVVDQLIGALVHSLRMQLRPLKSRCCIISHLFCRKPPFLQVTFCICAVGTAIVADRKESWLCSVVWAMCVVETAAS